jgi:hypothetical protein
MTNRSCRVAASLQRLSPPYICNAPIQSNHITQLATHTMPVAIMAPGSARYLSSAQRGHLSLFEEDVFERDREKEEREPSCLLHPSRDPEAGYRRYRMAYRTTYRIFPLHVRHRPVMHGRIWFLLVDSDCVRLLRKPCFLCDWLIPQLGCHAMRCARRKNATNPHPNFEAAQLGEGKECGGTQ